MTLPPTPAPKEFLPQPSPAIETIESFDKLLTTSDGISFEEVMRERNRVSENPPLERGSLAILLTFQP